MTRAQTRLLDPSFASDNVAGVSPEILDALARVNPDSALPYGSDPVTSELREVVKETFGPAAEILPVFNGTGANVVSLQALLPRWGAAICSTQAHVNNDEGAAPERVGSLKLLPRPTLTGKLSAADVEAEMKNLGFVHAAQPLAVTLTQSTELGTVYSPAEISEVAAAAHSHGVGVHMDGARISNAAAALGCTLGEITTEAGVDVLSLGGTKNGAMAAEAVVILDPDRLGGADYIRKFSMQLASKQRYISAQLLELFGTDLWRRNASHANAQAAKLGQALSELEGVTLSRPTEVNATFPEVPLEVAAAIREHYLVHVWDTASSGRPVLRLMCSWHTGDAEIEALVDCARRA
ncbi:threonine aldolase family protein [Nesterenkonia lutea]|uniref:Threonine aldolase n=1 Tax=Nesterenkonia lutea TaxID=272919 RepID=A0ABR9JDD2_9MICC|nr:beta-eliminating lyase-related protein [Nesterenkonia lutea]MBE1523798.1 threonine aldolase [Nesterenkonia lutea]